MKKLLAAGLALAASVCAAHAETATINLGDAYNAIAMPILTAIASAAGLVITAAAGYAVAWLRNKTGLQALELDAHHRDALQTAITNAAGLALNQLGNNLSKKTVDIANPAVGAAVQYVVKSAPEALDHFGINKRTTEIAEKIVAKIPQIANTTTPVVATPAAK